MKWWQVQHNSKVSKYLCAGVSKKTMFNMSSQVACFNKTLYSLIFHTSCMTSASTSIWFSDTPTRSVIFCYIFQLVLSQPTCRQLSSAVLPCDVRCNLYTWGRLVVAGLWASIMSATYTDLIKVSKTTTPRCLWLWVSTGLNDGLHTCCWRPHCAHGS